MAQKPNKTARTNATVETYIQSLQSANQRQDAAALVKLFKNCTKQSAIMWGPSIVGFGSYHYVYESGRSGDAAATGFSMRTSGPVVYIADGTEKYTKQLKNLGPHKTGVSCLYLKDLDSINIHTLKEVLAASYACVSQPGFGVAAKD